jgi:hypothetical protein
MQMRITFLTMFAFALSCTAAARGQNKGYAAALADKLEALQADGGDRAKDEARKAAAARTMNATTRQADAAARQAEADRAAEREKQLDAQAQQYVQMMQPLMWRELEFVRQTCDLKPSQRPQIKSAAEAGVKQAARDMVRPRIVNRSQSPATAGHTIRDSISKALEARLSKEQRARYEEEAAKRREANKQAAILSAVAQIDGALFLNQEQRDNIVQAIGEHWQDDWEQWIMMWQYAGQYLPQIPDRHVTPHLNDEQKTVWRGLQKVNVNSWGAQDRQAADDDWWAGTVDGVDEGKKVRAPAADSAP